MQLGPIRRHPARRTFSISIASRARPSVPHSLKPALITQIAGTFLLMQSSTLARTSSAGTTMIAEIDRGRNVGDTSIGSQSADLGGAPMDGHNRAAEFSGEQIVEHFRPDLSTRAIGTDHRD